METKKIRNGGFTLLETLLTVAILIILMALSAVGVARYKDYLDVTELDNAARDIYMAAENRAVLLQNSGASVKLLSTGGGGGDPVVLTSTQLKEDNNRDLLPAGTIDPALWKGDFRIVYDQVTGHVKEVFYAKKGTIDNSKLEQFRKDRSARVNLFRGGDPLVGYYGGDIAGEIVTKPLPTPGVEVFIDNGEELTLKVTYTLPEGLPTGYVATPSVKLTYGTQKVDDLIAQRTPTITENLGTAASGSQVTYEWVLDSLEQDSSGNYIKQFKDLGLIDLGGNFTVTAGLTLTATDWIESAYYAEGTDNSLFAKGSATAPKNPSDPDYTNTAFIANLRHLQNLRVHNSAFTSKVGNSITKAMQIENIECSKYKEKEYNFVPIYNASLTLYEGNDHEISNLNVNYRSNAGLFERIADTKGSKMTIQNLTMIAPNVSATGNAGAVVGRVGYYGSWVPATATIQNVSVINAAISAKNMGDNPGAGGVVGWVGGGKTCSISSCRVYWNDASQLTNENGEIVYKIDGQNAGGLVGTVGNGGADLATCKISNSYASTTVKAERSNSGYSGTAGGLIGLAYYDDRIEIDSSYADCYIKNTAEDAVWVSSGGLVGRVPPAGSSSSHVKITNCYAAGFIDGTSVHPAGLFYGELPSSVSKVTNCYSVVRVIKKDDKGKEMLEKPETPMYSGWNESSPGFAFYLSKAKDVTENQFGNAFEYIDADNSPETHVYDLRHQLNPTANPTLKLTPPYPFPGLKNVTETVTKPDGATEAVTITFPHYGDWAELEGSSGGTRLVYYETYENIKDPGVWGADADGKELRTLSDDAVVKTDGYALVFEEPVPNGYTITYGNAAKNNPTWTLKDESAVTEWQAPSGTADETDVQKFQVDAGGKTYTLVPLPSEIVLKAWKNMSQSDSNFYRKLVCGTGADAVTYWFNPHFAKTVVKQDQPDIVPEEPTNEEADAISVRTPRHFWNLGAIEYRRTYYNSSQVYVFNKEYYFQQELDLNFATYDVASADIDVTKGYKAIGQYKYGNDNTFRGTYDGQGHAIQNLRREYCINSESIIGLFGYSSGTLKNIVYHMDQFDCSVMGTNWGCAGGLATHSTGTVEDCTVIIQTGKLIGKGGGSYPAVLGAGGLVGYNGGSIVDSRVISSENPPEGSGWAVALETVQKSDSSYAFVGGLVGVNNGTISFSDDTRYSATIGTLETTSGYYRYLGGVAGRNGENGMLEKWTVSITDMSGGGYAGGLVGRNEGALRECETTVTNLTCNGSGVGGLAGTSSGSILNCGATVETLTNTAEGGVVGGLVGTNSGTVTSCTAEVTTLTNNKRTAAVGGLVGSSSGTIRGTETNKSSAKVGTLTSEGFRSYVGGLVGSSSGDAAIEYCTAEVTRLVNEYWECYVGGLAGKVKGDITNCTTTVANLTSVYADCYIGGLAGHSTGNVTDCTAEVTETLHSGGIGHYAGGLVGWSEKDVTNCRAKVGLLKSGGGGYPTNSGHIPNCNGGDACYAGGLVGQSRGTVEACKATVGGLELSVDWLRSAADVGCLVGRNEGTVKGCMAIAPDPLINKHTGAHVGGLVGCNTETGTIQPSWVAAVDDSDWAAELPEQINKVFAVDLVTVQDSTVAKASSGSGYVGGLVGYNAGIIADPSPDNAAGWGRARVKTLIADGWSTVGGLVGWNAARTPLTGWKMEIDTLNNTGTACASNGTTFSWVGGLAGQNEGVVESCTAKVGTLTDIANSENKKSTFSTYVGGLVGCNQKSGEVKNVEATVEHLTNSSPGACAGGLMGSNIGTISGESSAKVVELTNSGRDAEVGGLVGRNDGATIQGVCSAEVDTLTNKSAGYVGGLAGKNTGTIAATEAGEQCSAKVGTLTNSGNFGNVDSVHVGGLVGYNYGQGQVTGCTATVTGLLNEGNANNAIVAVGGLVGYNYDGLNIENHTAVIKDCAATVTTLTNSENGKKARVGGLVGLNLGTIGGDKTAGCCAEVGTLTNSGYDANVGGLAGYNSPVGVISECNTATTVTTLNNSGGYAKVGGLVGYNDGGKVEGNRTEVVALTNTAAGAKVGGLVGYNGINNTSGQRNGRLKSCQATVATLINEGTGNTYVGGLVGDNCSDQVENCQAAITGSADVAIALVNKGWSAHVGGLVGHNAKISSSTNTTIATLSNCSATVAGISNMGGSLSYVGGLVGCNGSYATTLSAKIIQGAATVSLTLENGKGGYVGGLVGCNYDYNASIQQSRAIVAELPGNNIGSLIGLNNSGSVTDCKANWDPMVGSGSINDSNVVDPNLSLTGYSGGADAVAAALPPEQPEGVKGRRKKSRREIG